MVIGVALLISVLFGAGDQYLGSLITHGWGSWTFAASQMATPWLLLPFLAGMTQPTQRRGAAVGLSATFAGLLGYFLTSLIVPGVQLGPLKWVALSQVSFTRFLHLQSAVLLGGACAGPSFGILGARWRQRRRWWCPAVLAACACLEPLIRAAADRLPPGGWVWPAEVLVGIAGALFVAIAQTRAARPTVRSRI